MKLTKSRLKQLIREELKKVIKEEVVVPDSVKLEGGQGKDGYWVYTATRGNFSGTGRHPVEGTAKVMAIKNLKKAMRDAIERQKKQKLDEVTTKREVLPDGQIKVIKSYGGKTGVGIAKNPNLANQKAQMELDKQLRAGSAPSQAAAKAPQAKPARMPQQRAAKGSAPMPNVVGKANQVSSDIEKFKRMIAQDGVVTAGEKAKLDKLSKGVQSVKKQAAKPAPSGPKYDPNDRRSINAAFKNKKISKDEWRKARRALARKSKAAARQTAQQQVSKVQKFMGLNEED